MDNETPLAYNNGNEGYVDYRSRPATRSETGGWRSAMFVIGVEVAERFAYFGIGSNLISYLTGPLGQSTAYAASSVNAWCGAGQLLPLFGAFIADSFLGRYSTIVIASLLYILGLGFLTVSTALSSKSCDQESANDEHICSRPEIEVIFIFFSLYIVALAQGGHKPCVQAFGADQFDEHDPEESRAKSSFFNWWNFGANGGILAANLVLSYIQDDLSWVFGFGIPCLVMIIGLLIFLLGTVTYRFPVKGSGSPRFKFLSTPLIADTEREVPGTSQVEGLEGVLRLVPIGATCLGYAIVSAQVTTFFTKQGFTMDRSITPGFEIAPASLLSLLGISTVILLPIYDRVFVPFMRTINRNPTGVTTLQRVGIGLFFSVANMVCAALVERKRLETALEYGLVDKANATVPMSVWWLVPQYLLYGVSDVLAVVGLQEFFYDQVPEGLRSVGIAMYLTIFGVGNFLSSILISVIEKVTGGGWFSDDLNQGHLDYFYWLLSGISALALAAYLYFSSSYVYKQSRRASVM